MRQIMDYLAGRRWLGGAVGLLVALAVVGTIIGVRGATAGRAAGTAPLPLRTQTATATPAFGAQSPAAADTLMIVVTELQFRSPVRVAFTRTLHDGALVRRVRAELETAMPDVVGPNTNIDCGNGTGSNDYTFDLRFFRSGAVVERATADTEGCQLWSIQTRNASVVRCCPDLTFWTWLHQETGAPLPLAGQPA